MAFRAKPRGHVAVPLLIFGGLAILLGMVAEMRGIFTAPTAFLLEAWQSGGLEVRAEMGLPGRVGILVTTIASFALAGAILGTPGTGRRLVLGLTAIFLSLSLIPAFAVWGIFWKPFGTVLAIAWAAFSSTIYAARHEMPCEVIDLPEAGNVIRMDGELEEVKSKSRSNGQG